MDKGCATCASMQEHDLQEPCSECVCQRWSCREGRFQKRGNLRDAEDMKPDTVNHPAHYTTGCGFECIEMMEMVFGKEAVIDYCVVNAFKYIWRHKQKNGTEDIAKAEWYLKYACKLTEGGLRRHLTAINKMTDHIEKLKGEATNDTKRISAQRNAHRIGNINELSGEPAASRRDGNVGRIR